MTNTPENKLPYPAIVRRAKELRQPLTPQEQKLRGQLRNRQLYGLKFRRQHPIGPFILDFYCHQRQLAIEIDGHSHAEPAQQRYDRARTEWLEGRGLRMIRFTNYQIEHNLEGVLHEIARQCGVLPSP